MATKGFLYAKINLSVPTKEYMIKFLFIATLNPLLETCLFMTFIQVLLPLSQVVTPFSCPGILKHFKEKTVFLYLYDLCSDRKSILQNLRA